MKKRKDKLSGSYYTPHKTVQFMKRYLANKNKIHGNMLEPSAGDGRFLNAFENETQIRSFVAVELDTQKVTALKERNYSDKVKVIADDFLDFAMKMEDKYHVIIGNPPYVNKKNMEEAAREKAKKICEKFALPDSLMQNLWVAFVLAAVSCLEEDGTLFFVLPMEFLQVQYAEKIRLFLEEHFDTINILSFRERMFPEIEQESCLVYLTNEFEGQPSINFEIYTELDSEEPCYQSKIERNKPLKKWTSAILSDRELDLLNNLAVRYHKVSEMCEAAPGIVTGANSVFILTEHQVQQLNCRGLVLPTISKSNMLNQCFLVSEETIRSLGKNGYRIYLLNLAAVEEKLIPESLRKYLDEMGNAENTAGIKLKDRYKCKNRRPWYAVPIVQNGEIFFFKRYGRMPRICVNQADIYTTDIAYNMRLLPEYDRESMAFCFYNTLTLTQCEHYGRYYAGGVSELIPSEFKRLSVPYRKIDREDISKLNSMFAQNREEDEIIAFVNSKTIENDLEKTTVEKLEKIRKKLMQRRLA